MTVGCVHVLQPHVLQVRSDRNQYSKHLIESQDEIAEMKRKFKIMNHQIEQLKEEIQAKDQVQFFRPSFIPRAFNSSCLFVGLHQRAYRAHKIRERERYSEERADPD